MLQKVRIHWAEEEGRREKEDMSMGVGSAGLEGFALSFGLILAIGPQNVFVMRQGMKRSHVFATCMACSLADAILIAAGILGVGAIVASIDGAESVIAYFAGAFLFGYGVLRIRSSMEPEGLVVEGEASESLSKVMAAVLAFTFLNPHVYFDTLFLIGGASMGFYGSERISFGIGASAASFLFFFSIGYGARRLSKVLDSPEAWRIIDRGIAAVMFVIAGAIVLPHL